MVAISPRFPTRPIAPAVVQRLISGLGAERTNWECGLSATTLEALRHLHEGSAGSRKCDASPADDTVGAGCDLTMAGPHVNESAARDQAIANAVRTLGSNEWAAATLYSFPIAPLDDAPGYCSYRDFALRHGGPLAIHAALWHSPQWIVATDLFSTITLEGQARVPRVHVRAASEDDPIVSFTVGGSNVQSADDLALERGDDRPPHFIIPRTPLEYAAWITVQPGSEAVMIWPMFPADAAQLRVTGEWLNGDSRTDTVDEPTDFSLPGAQLLRLVWTPTRPTDAAPTTLELALNFGFRHHPILIPMRSGVDNILRRSLLTGQEPPASEWPPA